MGTGAPPRRPQRTCVAGGRSVGRPPAEPHLDCPSRRARRPAGLGAGRARRAPRLRLGARPPGPARPLPPAQPARPSPCAARPRLRFRVGRWTCAGVWAGEAFVRFSFLGSRGRYGSVEGKRRAGGGNVSGKYSQSPPRKFWVSDGFVLLSTAKPQWRASYSERKVGLAHWKCL